MRNIAELTVKIDRDRDRDRQQVTKRAICWDQFEAKTATIWLDGQKVKNAIYADEQHGLIVTVEVRRGFLGWLCAGLDHSLLRGNVEIRFDGPEQKAGPVT